MANKKCVTCSRCTYCYYDTDLGWDCYLGKMGRFNGAYDGRKCDEFSPKEHTPIISIGKRWEE